MKNRKLLMIFSIIALFTVISAFPSGSAKEIDEIVPFIYAVHKFPSEFDPQNFYDTTSNDVAINHLEGLFAFDYSDPEMDLIPRLAADYGIWNENGTEWTIALRKDVMWHDGSSFTAADVKWNWDRLNFLANESLSHMLHFGGIMMVI